jgi:ubiquinone/menaquinone biosynthesis C-methylase UbiE
VVQILHNQILMPSITPEEFKEWNEMMVIKYDPDAFHHHTNPFIRFTENKRIKAIYKLINVSPQDCVLEIGCGAGNILEKAPMGKLFGIDISSFILNKSRKKLNEKFFLFQADAQTLPFKDLSFPRIICSEVLEHLLDPLASLNEMSRILKTQGITIISVPNELMINRIKSIFIRLGLFKWLFQRKGNYQKMPERMEDEWHLHVFKLEEWLDLFKKYFRVTRIKKIPFFWLPLRYVVRLEKIE